jgi:hypothetical protein
MILTKEKLHKLILEQMGQYDIDQVQKIANFIVTFEPDNIGSAIELMYIMDLGLIDDKLVEHRTSSFFRLTFEMDSPIPPAVENILNEEHDPQQNINTTQTWARAITTINPDDRFHKIKTPTKDKIHIDFEGWDMENDQEIIEMKIILRGE